MEGKTNTVEYYPLDGKWRQKGGVDEEFKN